MRWSMEFATGIYNERILGHLVAGCSAVFAFDDVTLDFLELSSMPKAPIESFWSAVWLGVRPFLRFMM